MKILGLLLLAISAFFSQNSSAATVVIELNSKDALRGHTLLIDNKIIRIANLGDGSYYSSDAGWKQYLENMDLEVAENVVTEECRGNISVQPNLLGVRASRGNVFVVFETSACSISTSDSKAKTMYEGSRLISYYIEVPRRLIMRTGGSNSIEVIAGGLDQYQDGRIMKRTSLDGSGDRVLLKLVN